MRVTKTLSQKNDDFYIPNGKQPGQLAKIAHNEFVEPRRPKQSEEIVCIWPYRLPAMLPTPAPRYTNSDILHELVL